MLQQKVLTLAIFRGGDFWRKISPNWRILIKQSWEHWKKVTICAFLSYMVVCYVVGCKEIYYTLQFWCVKAISQRNVLKVSQLPTEFKSEYLLNSNCNEVYLTILYR